ncbi:hypothetical protein [Fibrobacter sp. UWT2]|uniref:hypothetical protein n=1 Tax=Fibrobacter sp. UWT2 TaxID=1896224 RepID=UPI00116037D4|nr:hypothetical protein [Fibrobacter sp. UWT2]
MKFLFVMLILVIGCFWTACTDDGVSSEALYSIEVGQSACSKDSIALANMAAKMYQEGTCDFATVYSKMTSSCGAKALEVHRNVSFAQLDSLLFVSMATMELQSVIKNVIDKCDEFYLYAGGLYMFVERQDDGRGYK